MALEELEILNNSEVFTHRRLGIGKVAHLYKPFGEICTSNPEQKIEDELDRDHIIMVKDKSGTGKTSLVNFVLSQLDETAFPILFRLSVEGNFEKICSDPASFTRYLLSKTLNSVEQCMGISKEEKEAYRKFISGEISYSNRHEKGLKGSLSNKFNWMPGIASTSVDLGGEIKDYTESAINAKLYNSDRIRCIMDLCDVIREYNRKPIFFFDDTDNFLKRGSVSSKNLVNEFFIKIAPMLEEYSCAVIINAHTYYDEYKEFKSSQRKHFDRVIGIPNVPFNGFVELVKHKMKVVLPDTPIEEVFEQDALEWIYEEAYESNDKEQMRNTMLTLSEAIDVTIEDGSKSVSKPEVTHAMYELFAE